MRPLKINSLVKGAVINCRQVNVGTIEKNHAAIWRLIIAQQNLPGFSRIAAQEGYHHFRLAYGIDIASGLPVRISRTVPLHAYTAFLFCYTKLVNSSRFKNIAGIQNR